MNCAGWDELKPFLDSEEAFQARVLEINLAGPIRLTRLVLPAMIEARWGRIVNIGSDAGRVGSSLEAIYSGAKGGRAALPPLARRAPSARCRRRPEPLMPSREPTELLDLVAGRVPEADAALDAIGRWLRAHLGLAS